MSKIVSGKFIARAAAFNVECGFVPSYVKAISALGGTELEFEFFKILADLEVSGQYGFTLSTTGVPEPAASGSGIVPYDASANKVSLPSPTGQGEAFADHPDPWTKSLSDAASARTTTALGSLVKPTSGNENGLIAECTTAGTGSSTEPTWPSRPGQTVTDGTTVWTMREYKSVVVGVKGFTVQAGIATNGELWVFKAEEHDRFEDMGDADVKDPLIFAS